MTRVERAATAAACVVPFAAWPAVIALMEGEALRLWAVRGGG